MAGFWPKPPLLFHPCKPNQTPSTSHKTGSIYWVSSTIYYSVWKRQECMCVRKVIVQLRLNSALYQNKEFRIKSTDQEERGQATRNHILTFSAWSIRPWLFWAGKKSGLVMSAISFILYLWQNLSIVDLFKNGLHFTMSAINSVTCRDAALSQESSNQR